MTDTYLIKLTCCVIILMVLYGNFMPRDHSKTETPQLPPGYPREKPPGYQRIITLSTYEVQRQDQLHSVASLDVFGTTMVLRKTR